MNTSGNLLSQAVMGCSMLQESWAGIVLPWRAYTPLLLESLLSSGLLRGQGIPRILPSELSHTCLW